MRKQYTLIAAATLAVAGLGLSSSPSWGEQQQSGQTYQQAGGMGQQQTRVNLPAGIERKEENVDNVRDTLGDVTEACLSKDKDYDKILSYLVDADKERLKALGDKPMDAQLAGRIEQIRQAWQQKYNKDLSIDSDVAFGDQFKGLEIVRGEIVNPALLSNWPVQNQPQTGTQQQLDQQQQMQQPQAGQQQHLDKGREVAVVTFPASHGLPECNVSLVREGMSWKIDIPDSITTDQFHQNLLTHLTRFGEQSAQWGSDANLTSQLAAHHLFLSFYGISGQGGAQQSGFQSGQDQNLQQDQNLEDQNLEQDEETDVEQD